MSYPNAIEVCRAELFTKEVELRERYPGQMVEKVLRVREMYNWFIANPDGTDREFVAEVCQRHNIHRTTAYSDLAVVKSLLPMLGSASRDFHRWRTNGKLNRVDLEDEQAIPLDQILVQPFTATDDPRVLGIEPIPNIADKIAAMIEKYRAETIDIEDVEFEEVDLEFDSLFPDPKNNSDDGTEESVL